MGFANMLRRLSRGGFGLLALLITAGPVLADVSVIIGYETRAVGEIEPCG